MRCMAGAGASRFTWPPAHVIPVGAVDPDAAGGRLVADPGIPAPAWRSAGACSSARDIGGCRPEFIWV